ncbi:NADH dehydrogenase [ubiquinone] 1 alpha subcomplex subunit 13 [Neodiprion virginianus]|uniref:NADH dehydrogenase [ubiquinone] 1 alpha subcomplex subunit 13 n=1 Tax=Neodiprion virginianus TaxID=2961670 RepID=UPI001EE70071|nr:NADH dehydrogenase [ubiquinone] 1 alpha subcomplex subunit 13 [Neodiprion virginianus]XP_046611755.1 NADH dehydrogenase [ubiquinone] 1 alpha subcomplex subunit 13 [Neodiprion virginianus]
MATAAKTTPQDLPPKGGYGPIVTERTKLRSIFSGRSMILGYFAVTSVSFYIYFKGYKVIKKHEVEMRSARMVMFPLLLAERDREYLKQLRRNRDSETELMKNVKNWETGTYYGEPIYKTAKSSKLIEPDCLEYYAFASDKDYQDRAEISLWT